MKQTIEEKTEIPKETTVTIETLTYTVKGPKGEVTRKRPPLSVNMTLEGNHLMLKSLKATKREKKHLYSTLAHLKNMLKGVQQPYTYTLKICSGHFPMNVSTSNNQFIVKNFLGEKQPRTMTLKPGAKVTIQGDRIIIESPDKEKAGQTASEIELLTRISKRDPRVFQDGIYLIEKAGEPIA